MIPFYTDQDITLGSQVLRIVSDGPDYLGTDETVDESEKTEVKPSKAVVGNMASVIQSERQGPRDVSWRSSFGELPLHFITNR